MKVVLFCGGLGMRIREYAGEVPKPMVPIGYRPILWHLMKYYAHHGHNDFILCLGYKADVIKNFFLSYQEAISNDFVLSEGCKKIELLRSDMTDWRITFVDTGLHASVGQRLASVRNHLAGEEIFMANYADGLTDLDLSVLVEHFRAQNKVALMLCVRPVYSFHVVRADGDSVVQEVSLASESELLINAGFYIFRKEVFDYIREGEDLVNEPFQRLIADKQLVAYRYSGFWACMDTFKEKQNLEEIYLGGQAPWEVWRSAPRNR